MTDEGVLDLIHRYGYTGFPVVDNEKLVGIITFEDGGKFLLIKEILLR